MIKCEKKRKRKKRKKKRRDKKMALVDVRQLVAGMLTFSMFIMLGNMIRKDHFGTAIVSSVFVNCLFYST